MVTRTPQLSLSPSHYFLSDLMENHDYLKGPLRVLVESLSVPHTTPGDTHANLNRLKANLNRCNYRLIRQSAGDRPKGP
jgi:hypothetical protein